MTEIWTDPATGEQHVVGDKWEAGAACDPPVSGETFNYYSNRQSVGCPQPVSVSLTTRRKLWVLKQVRDWDAHRPGPGDWAGKGARSRWAKERENRERARLIQDHPR
jgi:hypothetical protein